MGTLFIAIISVALSVMAQFALKAGMSNAAAKEALAQHFGIQTLRAVLMNKFVLLGFALYGLGAVVWLAVLSKWDVSKAYPLVGMGFILTAAVGWMIGEHLTILRLAGIALIFVGIVCVGRS